MVINGNLRFGLCRTTCCPAVYRVSLAYHRAIASSASASCRSSFGSWRGARCRKELTHDLAQLLYKQLDSPSARSTTGLHMCMAARGVEAHEARLDQRGARGLINQPATRQGSFWIW